MIFNSIDFAIFLPIVFCVYWLFKTNIKAQNVVILVSSYIFYGWWDYRFLGLIFFSSLIDYVISLQIPRRREKINKKLLLGLSIFVNLGLLIFFKYSNFFLDTFYTSFKFFGYSITSRGLDIVLPVGISFYTFQTLSYTIDVYKKEMKPTNDFIGFSAYVSFFPQLVAGPIERARNLLPQFYIKRTFNYGLAVVGLRQILWGLFKKIVIADNCAQFANEIFDNSEVYSGSTLALGAFFFAFQIYGDFSGYSDIAIGTSRLFGFKLSKNFNFPYFSRDVAEFWRRWHISLSTWFRDYLYIPLGGSKTTPWKKIRNIFLIFIVSGFWHGPKWTFIIWGSLNAFLFLPLLLLNLNRKNIDNLRVKKSLPSVQDLIKIIVTFSFICFTWVFFRAEDLEHALSIIKTIFSKSVISMPAFEGLGTAFKFLPLLVFFIFLEWIGKEGEFAIEKLTLKYTSLRHLFYYFLVFLIVFYGAKSQEFIYFQF